MYTNAKEKYGAVTEFPINNIQDFISEYRSITIYFSYVHVHSCLQNSFFFLHTSVFCVHACLPAI